MSEVVPFWKVNVPTVSKLEVALTVAEGLIPLRAVGLE